MKRRYRYFKDLCLLIGGTLVAIIVEAFFLVTPKNLWILIVVTIILELLGFGIINLQNFNLIKRFNRRSHKIGIYAPHENKISINSTWVNDLQIQEILDLLNNSGIKTKRVLKESVFDRFPIVINPYGGVYPEEDLSTLVSLDRVFDFVRTGGIYINIADIPFYYAFDKKLNRRIDTTPFSKIVSAPSELQVQRLFIDTLLTTKLHCFVSSNDSEEAEGRVISMSSSESNLFEELTEDKKFSPVVKIPYGKGYFMFSTLQLNRENMQKNIIRVVAAALSAIQE